jgi:hypothetical protein
MFKNQWIWLVPVAFVFVGCKKPADYMYNHPDPVHMNSSVKVKEFVGTNQIDILWVIDNSGSMQAHQQNVLNNMDQFIQTLAAATTLDWKSGLISTTLTDSPYAGFDPGTELLSSDPQVGAKFKSAVGRLGLDGDGTERMFAPMEKVLDNYPNFLRPGAGLAIIIISDAPEQSSVDVNQFLGYIKQAKGSLSNVYFYGFLNPVDWCVPTDDTWSWAGSPFETLSTSLPGHVYKLCDPKFASNLTDLGQNLGHLATSSFYRLKKRPIASTLKVYYQGQEVPGGPRSAGGYWIFDVNQNAIEFSDLSFASGNNASVDVSYDVDDGT